MALMPLEDLREFNIDRMHSFVRENRMTRSHMESSLVSRSRAKFHKIQIDSPEYFYQDYIKHDVVYKIKGAYFYPIEIPYFDYIDTRTIKEKRDIIQKGKVYNLIEFFTLSRKVCNKDICFDTYFDGSKEINGTLRIIWFGGNNFTIISFNDNTPFSLILVIRKNIKDYYILGQQLHIPIPVSEYNNMSLSNKVIIGFKDGYKSPITINKDETGVYILFTEESKIGLEILIMDKNDLENETALIVPDDKWFDMRYLLKQGNKNKLTIHPDNILCYVNGLLSNITIKQKGNHFAKINEFADYSKELYIFNKEYEEEIISTTDYLYWYMDELNRDIIKELNSDIAPSFITQFKNCDVDTTMNTATASQQDGYDYGVDTIKKLISYDAENFLRYTESYMKDRKNYTTSYYLNMKEYDYISMTRNDSNDIPIAKYHETFDFPMVLIEFENPENKPYYVYVDGVKMFKNIVCKRCFSKEYIYIRQNKITPVTNIEIETYECDKEQIVFEALINANGKYILPENMDYHRYVDMISVFKIIDDRVEKVNVVNYDCEKGELTIEPKEHGLYKIVLNNAIQISDYVINSRKVQEVSFECVNLQLVEYNIDNIRVYKNGKYIPRKYYNIEFPTKENGLTYPRISLNCRCYMSEHIAVEYNPYRVKEMYNIDIIDDYGRIMLESTDMGYPISMAIDNIYLNGRKLSIYNIKQHTANNIELINILSKKHFTIQFKEDFLKYTNFPEFTNIYNNAKNLYGDYRKSLIAGSRIDDMESDVIEKDFNIMRDLYWDLYNDYLKKNIVDFGAKVPDLIAIKYADLVDLDNMIYIDCSEQMNHWMPLDASKTAEENMDSLLQLYDDLLKEIMASNKIDPYEMSKEQIERFGKLANKNVLVIDLSHKQQ